MFAYQFEQRTKMDIHGKTSNERVKDADLDCRIWLVQNTDVAITRTASLWLIDTVVRIADHFSQFVLEYFKEGSPRLSRDYCRAYPGAPLRLCAFPFP